MELREIFKEEGLLAKHMRSFEFRPEQLLMSEAVQEAINSNKYLLAEVGTGVGKSLAYLIPFIKWAVESNKRVVISTYTKTLQEQLVNKDLPFLQEVLAVDFNFALCLGGQNYLCLRRLNQGYTEDIFDNDQEKYQSKQINVWAGKTKTGLFTDLEFEPMESVWNKMCRESDLCLGRKCLYRKDCFYNKAKLKEYKAHILVVNHHLFFANLASAGKVLPNFEAVVFDEAHILQDVATEYLGIEITNFRIKKFLDLIYNPQSAKGVLNKLRKINPDKAEKIKVALDEVRSSAAAFFSDFIAMFGRESKVQRVRESRFIPNQIKEPLTNLMVLLSELLENIKDQEDKIQVNSLISRARAINLGLELIINQELDEQLSSFEDMDIALNEIRNSNGVYWIEILDRPRYPKYSLSAAPVDISALFRHKVLDNLNLIVFTSATLSTNGKFDFIKESLGIKEANELILSSPFDYGNQVLVYIPDYLPDPVRDFDEYKKEVIVEIGRIVRLMQGRTFVLFTNYKMLEAAERILVRDFKGYNILRQGDVPRYKLLDRFKSEKNSVLLGTNTFWQGIDVPGRALECVIITKLPFSVPDDPIIEVRMELLIAKKKDPFINYQIPQAVIMFRQGFGRLIRKKSDIGIVAILDPRIKTRFYGRSFLDALPKCQMVSSLKDVEHFFHFLSLRDVSFEE